jgi:hypothetical protein
MSWRALALCVLLTTGGAQAADAPDKRLAAARDAARQAQAALQQARAERDALQSQQATTAADKASLEARLAQTEAQSRNGRVKQAQQAEALSRAEAELERLRTELAQEQGRREQAEKAAAQTRAQGEQALLAQRQVTASVTALLEKSTAALAHAERANRSLHKLGLEAVEAYSRRTPEAMRVRDEPFLGLGAVALEEEAEHLRKALDEQRVAP